MNDKLMLCLSDKVEFDNSHCGNTLKEIAAKDWLLSQDEKDIKGIIEKYTSLLTQKYLTESEELSKQENKAELQYDLAVDYWACTKKIRRLGE